MDAQLAKKLIETQFPQWKDLPIRPVAKSGWDNTTFHLGDNMLIRLPSAEEYASQVEKEQMWLPKLAKHLPLPIPTPIACGHPDASYPFKWSIYSWIEGESAATAKINNLTDFAKSLADFLIAFHKIDFILGPKAGPHSFYRGGSLTHYDSETREALTLLKSKIDTRKALKLWEEALKTEWKKPPVWVHGDISSGNLLVQNGKLSAVIDFGQLAVGDPACDLSIAWTFFDRASRETFLSTLQLDEATLTRAKAWALWKALIVCAGLSDPNNKESQECSRIIDECMF